MARASKEKANADVLCLFLIYVTSAPYCGHETSRRAPHSSVTGSSLEFPSARNGSNRSVMLCSAFSYELGKRVGIDVAER